LNSETALGSRLIVLRLLLRALRWVLPEAEERGE